MGPFSFVAEWIALLAFCGVLRPLCFVLVINMFEQLDPAVLRSLEFAGAIKEWSVEDFLINGEWFRYKIIFRKVKRRRVSGK